MLSSSFEGERYSVTLTRCCFRTSANKANIPFLIKSVHIFYNMILIKTDVTNFIKSLYGEYIIIWIDSVGDSVSESSASHLDRFSGDSVSNSVSDSVGDSVNDHVTDSIGDSVSDSSASHPAKPSSSLTSS